MKTFFYRFLPMFSTLDGKMVNVVENADCFSRRLGRVVISYNPPELICVQGVVTGDHCGHLMADVS